MKGKETIELTQQELEDLKDAIKFRTTVIYQLKLLTGIPDRVTKLETTTKIIYAIVMFFVVAVIGAYLK